MSKTINQNLRVLGEIRSEKRLVAHGAVQIPKWQSDFLYKEEDVVEYENALWRCIEQHSAQAWEELRWRPYGADFDALLAQAQGLIDASIAGIETPEAGPDEFWFQGNHVGDPVVTIDTGYLTIEAGDGIETFASDQGDLVRVSGNRMVGATPTEEGAGGDVPLPAAGDNDKFLRGDGAWAEVSGMPAFDGTGSPSYSFLNGSGDWFDFEPILSSLGVFAGRESGLVPFATEEQWVNHFLRADGVWVDLSPIFLNSEFQRFAFPGAPAGDDFVQPVNGEISLQPNSGQGVLVGHVNNSTLTWAIDETWLGQWLNARGVTPGGSPTYWVVDVDKLGSNAGYAASPNGPDIPDNRQPLRVVIDTAQQETLTLVAGDGIQLEAPGGTQRSVRIRQRPFVGATTQNGQAGGVPQPMIADAGKFLKGDGTWASAGSTEKWATSTQYSAGDMLYHRDLTRGLDTIFKVLFSHTSVAAVAQQAQDVENSNLERVVSGPIQANFRTNNGSASGLPMGEIKVVGDFTANGGTVSLPPPPSVLPQFSYGRVTIVDTAGQLSGLAVPVKIRTTGGATFSDGTTEKSIAIDNGTWIATYHYDQIQAKHYWSLVEPASSGGASGGGTKLSFNQISISPAPTGMEEVFDVGTIVERHVGEMPVPGLLKMRYDGDGVTMGGAKMTLFGGYWQDITLRTTNLPGWQTLFYLNGQQLSAQPSGQDWQASFRPSTGETKVDVIWSINPGHNSLKSQVYIYTS